MIGDSRTGRPGPPADRGGAPRPVPGPPFEPPRAAGTPRRGFSGDPSGLRHLDLTDPTRAASIALSPIQDKSAPSLPASTHPDPRAIALVVHTPSGARLAVTRQGSRYAAVSEVIEGIVTGAELGGVIAAAALAAPEDAWVQATTRRALANLTRRATP